MTIAVQCIYVLLKLCMFAACASKIVGVTNCCCPSFYVPKLVNYGILRMYVHTYIHTFLPPLH